MRERHINDLIEQQDPEVKQRVWEKISGQIEAIKQISLFTYINTGNGYVKQPIPLLELIARLSDKRENVARAGEKNITRQSDDTTLDNVGTQGSNET